MGKRKTNAHKPWRPDFRDSQALPDLKIVRTHFLLNLVAGMFFLIVTGLLVYQEYEISVRTDTLAELVASVDRNIALDKSNVADSARFMREAKKVLEVSAFLDQPFDPCLLVVALARAQVPQGRYISLDYQRKNELKDDKPVLVYRVMLNGTMGPSATKSAPQLIDSFVSSLGSLDIIRDCGAHVELVTASRDKDQGGFSYTIRIELFESGKDAAK